MRTYRYFSLFLATMLFIWTPLLVATEEKSISELVTKIIPNAQQKSGKQSGDVLVINYTIPLEYRSAGLKIVYKIGTGEVRFEADFQNIFPIQGALGAAAELLNAAGLWHLVAAPNVTSSLSKGSVSFAWQAKDGDEVEQGLQYFNQFVDYALTFDLKEFANVLIKEAKALGQRANVHAWALKFLKKEKPVNAGAEDLVGYVLLQQEDVFQTLGELLELPNLQPDWELADAAKNVIRGIHEQQREKLLDLTQEILDKPFYFRSPVIRNAFASILVAMVQQGMLTEDITTLYQQWLTVPTDEDFAGSKILLAIAARSVAQDDLFSELLQQGLHADNPVVRGSIIREVIRPLIDSQYQAKELNAVVRTMKDDPDLQVRLAVLSTLIPKFSSKERSTLGMDLVKSLFRTPEDRELILAFDVRHFFSLVGILQFMLSDTDNDALLQETWINLAPAIARDKDFPDAAMSHFSRDLSDALVQSNAEGQVSLVKLINQISNGLENDPQGAQVWLKIRQGVIKSLSPKTQKTLIDQLKA